MEQSREERRREVEGERRAGDTVGWTKEGGTCRGREREGGKDGWVSRWVGGWIGE